MIGDVIDTFKNARTAVNQELFSKKVKLRQESVTGLHTQKFECQSCPFRLRHFAAQCLNVFTINKAKMNKDHPKKSILPVYDG